MSKRQKEVHIILLPAEDDLHSDLLYNKLKDSYCYRRGVDEMYWNDGKVNNANFHGPEKAENNGFIPHFMYYVSRTDVIKEGDAFISATGKLMYAIKEYDAKFQEDLSKVIASNDPRLKNLPIIDSGDVMSYFNRIKKGEGKVKKVLLDLVLVEPDEKSLTKFEPFYGLDTRNNDSVIATIPEQDPEPAAQEPEYTDREFEIAYCLGLLNSGASVDQLTEVTKTAQTQIDLAKKFVKELRQ